MGVVFITVNISEDEILLKFPVARFNASYPSSNTGYSMNPSPLGIERNSDSRQEKTDEIYGSGLDLISSKVASKGNFELPDFIWLLALSGYYLLSIRRMGQNFFQMMLN